MYDNSCNYKDRCSCADMYYTVVALVPYGNVDFISNETLSCYKEAYY